MKSSPLSLSVFAFDVRLMSTLACGPDNRLIENTEWTTAKRKDGHTEWIPPPQLDTGQTRVNDLHHPERMLRPPEDDTPPEDDDIPSAKEWEAPQPQTVGHHETELKAIAAPAIIGSEQAERRKRKCCDVVGERPEQIALTVRNVCARQADLHPAPLSESP